MSSEHLAAHAELYFRTHLHTSLPLHAALVDTICRARVVPLELATVLEDIGQAYISMSETVNAELVQRDRLKFEADADKTTEHRIEAFVRSLVSRLGMIRFRDGRAISGRRAIESFPVAADALRTAVLIELASAPRPDHGQDASRPIGRSP